MKGGRKAANESRATEIRARLVTWKQSPEPQRISLRALAAEIGTSHQLLSFYLKRLDKWQMKEYRRKAEEIRDRAQIEKRPLTQWEETQAHSYERAAFHCMLDSVFEPARKKMLKEIQANVSAHRTLSKYQLKVLLLLARYSDPSAQEILRAHTTRAPHQSRRKIGKNNLPAIPAGAVKSFRCV
jgi:hypothetical protein